MYLLLHCGLPPEDLLRIGLDTLLLVFESVLLEQELLDHHLLVPDRKIGPDTHIVILLVIGI